MPKTKRGHHRTKRSGRARHAVRQRGYRPVRYEASPTERVAQLQMKPIENRLPLVFGGPETTFTIPSPVGIE